MDDFRIIIRPGEDKASVQVANLITGIGHVVDKAGPKAANACLAALEDEIRFVRQYIIRQSVSGGFHTAGR